MNPGASKQYAELMVQMKKDSELEPIIAEIEANGPAAMLKYVFFHSLETGIRFISVYGEGICFRF